MPVPPHIFTIAPDRPFLATLARGLLALAGGDPLSLTRMTVLLPTRRAARSLREAFLRLTAEGSDPGAPLLLPRLRPIGAARGRRRARPGRAAHPAAAPPGGAGAAHAAVRAGHRRRADRRSPGAGRAAFGGRLARRRRGDPAGPRPHLRSPRVGADRRGAGAPPPADGAVAAGARNCPPGGARGAAAGPRVPGRGREGGPAWGPARAAR